jgi:uncharacterized protein
MKLCSNTINESNLKLLYKLNQQNVPELGSLDNTDRLKSLIDKSFKILILKELDQIIGFCLLFKEDSSYDSPNYLYFKNKFDKFLYIDRVVVASSFTGKGGGKLMYDQVFKVAASDNLTVCCEVNVKPLNKVSLAFHKNLGFLKTNEKVYAEKKVAFLEKPPLMNN